MEGEKCDGKKSTLQKTLRQDPKAADRTARTCRKTYKAWNIEQIAYLYFFCALFRKKPSDFAWITKLDYDKKNLLLSSAYPITETTHKTPKSAYLLSSKEVMCIRLIAFNMFQHIS